MAFVNFATRRARFVPAANYGEYIAFIVNCTRGSLSPAAVPPPPHSLSLALPLFLSCWKRGLTRATGDRTLPANAP